MTEDEAKTKWCPFARPGAVRPEDCGEVRGNRYMDGSPDPGALCVGSACVAWQKTVDVLRPNPTPVGDKPTFAASGFCGLVVHRSEHSGGRYNIEAFS